MKFDWRLYNYRRDFPGKDILHTRLSLCSDTPFGQVKLQLRVAWDVPVRCWSHQLPMLSEVTLKKNYCRTFTVVLLGGSRLLEQRTLEYFDGEGSEFKTSGDARVLFCNRKWAAGATRLVNRYDANVGRNLVALRRFMERRMLNAYGPLCG